MIRATAPLLCMALLAGCVGHSHYAGLESRDIKALSTEDIEGLKSGRGMRMALPAELNGYPGPLHEAHLEQVRILSAAQVAQYNRLRGYAP